MFVESLIISKPLFSSQGAVSIGVRAPFGKARLCWPFCGCLINSPTSSLTRRKAQSSKVGYVSSPGSPLLCPEAPHRCGWAGHLQGTHIGFLPSSLKKTYSFQAAGAMPRVSAKASPALQMEEKPHFCPEHSRKAGVVALLFGALIVLGKGGLSSPPGDLMMGDKEPQLPDTSSFSPKGNQITPPWFCFQEGRVTVLNSVGLVMAKAFTTAFFRKLFLGCGEKKLSWGASGTSCLWPWEHSWSVPDCMTG